MAAKEFRRLGLAESEPFLRRMATPGNLLSVWVAGAAYVVVLGIVSVFHEVSPHFLGSFAPHAPGNVLQTMWQVQAALVALAFPFLVFLIQVAREREMVIASTAHVLAQRTGVVASLIFAGGGVAILGVISAWLVSDSAVVIALALVLVPTILFLGFAYWVAIDLLFHTPKLKRLAVIAVRQKLRASMDWVWIYRKAQELLAEALTAHGAVYQPFDLVYQRERGRWFAIVSDRGGLIGDVSAAGLGAALDAIGRLGMPPAGPMPTRPTGAGPAPGPPPIRLLRTCGEHVQVGDQLLLLDRHQLQLPLQAGIEDQVLRAFRIVSADA